MRCSLLFLLLSDVQERIAKPKLQKFQISSIENYIDNYFVLCFGKVKYNLTT